MWVGSFEKLNECPCLTEKAKAKILDFIHSNDMQTLPLGRHDLGGDDFVNIFEYETHESKIFEAHKVYIDIHYTIKGNEKVLWADKYAQETKPYNAEEDYSLGTVDNFREIESSEGPCVFCPGEIHQAGVISKKAEKVKKAVFKIKA